WDLGQIQAQQITDNVVELMVAKVQKLPPQTQAVLKLAACMGNKFDLKQLAIVYEKAPQETATDLWAAIAEGLILPLNDAYKLIEMDVAGLSEQLVVEYKFAHDRIQQAAYYLIPQADKQSVHLQVGQLLIKNTSPRELEDNLFDIVNQLNIGQMLIYQQTERDALANLNLQAGKKAKASAAYQPGFNYLKFGLDLLEEGCWQRQYDLTLELYVEAAEAAYLSTDFEEMERLTEIVLKQAKTLLDKVKAYEVSIQGYWAENKNLEAVNTALKVLKLLGVVFPAQPSLANMMLTLEETQLVLTGKVPSDLIDLPTMTDPIALAAMQIMTIVWSPAYITVNELIPLIACKQVNLSVTKGNAPESAFAYANYGLIICGSGQIDTAYQLGQLALCLLEQFNAKKLKAKIYVFCNFVRHLKEHLRKVLLYELEAYQSGLESGDFEFAAGGAMGYCMMSYLSGRELLELEREQATYNQAIAQLKQEAFLQWHQMFWQVVLNLIGRSENPYCLNGEVYDETRMLPLHLKATDKTAMLHLYTNKVTLCYQFYEFQQALENAVKLEEYIVNASTTCFAPPAYFYDSLARLAVFLNASETEQNRILEKVTANQEKMELWAHHAPMNYLHKFYLVEAERDRVLGNDKDAREYYDKAIALARENEYLNEEALAYELAGRFYLARNQNHVARHYLQDAHYAYQRWGAVAKVKDLEARYPQFLALQSVSSTQNTKNPITTTSGRAGETLDFAAVMKASQAISGEIVLAQLLDRVMKAAIENAGAEKGFLILDKSGNWVIEAQAAVESDRITILQSIPVDSVDPATQIPLLSTAIVNYVARSHENVVLNNATESGQFTRDAYILATQTKSILCTPLLDRGKLAGILYLENNLAIGAFTPQRVETLQIIAAQAAISIENAQLYEQLEDYNRTLEQKVEERTKELSHTLEILKATQAELVIENALLRSAEEPQGYDYQVGGSLPIDAPTYVVRSADRHLYKALRLGQLCYILNTRQMGKSSLRVQIMKKLQAEGFACVAIDISTMSNSQVTLEQWYAGFAYLLVSGLNLLDKVNIRTWWRERELLSPVQRLSEFLNEVLLTNISEKIIIFIDEIDSVLDLQFDSSAFFGIIRTCYNKRADSSDYQRLNFVLLGVATPSQLIQDKNRTPFNVGQAIQLKGFQAHEAQPLLQGLTKRVTNPQTLLTEVINWTGGQPFLTQKVCKLICNSNSPIPTNDEAAYVENLVRSHIIENWESQDQPEHLRTIRDRILNDKQRAVELLQLYRQILHQGQIIALDNSAETELVMSGLAVKRDDYLQINNRIYKLVFDERWVEKQINRL
ncbi:AAA-like domain-containing protein, partial [Planktothrix sp. FACHB-1355]